MVRAIRELRRVSIWPSSFGHIVRCLSYRFTFWTQYLTSPASNFSMRQIAARERLTDSGCIVCQQPTNSHHLWQAMLRSLALYSGPFILRSQEHLVAYQEIRFLHLE